MGFFNEIILYAIPCEKINNLGCTIIEHLDRINNDNCYHISSYKEKRMIKTKNLKFLDILEYPDLEISPAAFNFLTGKSGVGKSAFLRMLNRSNQTPKDSIFIDGVDITSINPLELRKDFLLCGQNVFLFNGTIKENFLEFYKLRGLETPSDAHIKTFLEMVMSPFEVDAKVDSMSGGERQRVYLSIFVSMAQKVLLMDEPTSALDKATGHAVIANIKAYAAEKNIGCIIISHDETLASEFAEHIIHLENIHTEVHNG